VSSTEPDSLSRGDCKVPYRTAKDRDAHPAVEVLLRRIPLFYSNPHNDLFPVTVLVEAEARTSRMSQHRATLTRVFGPTLLSGGCPVVQNRLDTHLASDELRQKSRIAEN
jgi:hypothetical protein